VGRRGHERGDGREDRAFPVHPDGFVAESEAVTHRFFFGFFFYFPCLLAEGTG
jgi:hypothetical protein